MQNRLRWSIFGWETRHYAYETNAFAFTALFCCSRTFRNRGAEQARSVIHVITIQWKVDATPEQIQQAIQAAENLNYPGLKNVWTKPIKMQLPDGYKHIIVMEFESEEEKYADSPAQKKWYEAYMPIREESSTHDITN